MASLFSFILMESRQVALFRMGGWSSESFMKENIETPRGRTRVRDEKTVGSITGMSTSCIMEIMIQPV